MSTAHQVGLLNGERAMSVKTLTIKRCRQIKSAASIRRCGTGLSLTIVVAVSLPTNASAERDTVTSLVGLSLEELTATKVDTVYAASKYEQKTTEAPSSVSIITQDEIQRYGHRTLADVLQSVQGFHVSNDRNYAFLGARGISLGDFNSRVLLLVDGHRVNNNLTDGAFIDTAFLLDVDLIDRVEIIRGPGTTVAIEASTNLVDWQLWLRRTRATASLASLTRTPPTTRCVSTAAHKCPGGRRAGA